MNNEYIYIYIYIYIIFFLLIWKSFMLITCFLIFDSQTHILGIILKLKNWNFNIIDEIIINL